VVVKVQEQRVVVVRVVVAVPQRPQRPSRQGSRVTCRHHHAAGNVQAGAAGMRANSE
jgi:hypothetical protein